jgi:hypothetical protein
MRPEIYLSTTEIARHFLSLGASGRGVPSISLEGRIDLPEQAAQPVVGPWDAIEQCIIELDWVADLFLSRSQMRSLLRQTGLMDKIVEFGEVETQIRENLANEMSEALIGKGWPTYGDIRDGLDFDQFVAEFRRAGEVAGFRRAQPH